MLMLIPILNTTILPSHPRPLVAVVLPINVAVARALADNGVRSHVGHDSTAQIASTLLGVPVPMDRTPWQPSEAPVAVVLQLRGRPPEGTILSTEDVERIGYDLRLLVVGEDSIEGVRNVLLRIRNGRDPVGVPLSMTEWVVDHVEPMIGGGVW